MAVVQLIMLFSGLAFWVLALNRRKEEAPGLGSIGFYHPRNWVPVWKQSSWFTPVGFKFYLTGTILIVASGLLRLVTSLL